MERFTKILPATKDCSGILSMDTNDIKSMFRCTVDLSEGPSPKKLLPASRLKDLKTALNYGMNSLEIPVAFAVEEDESKLSITIERKIS